MVYLIGKKKYCSLVDVFYKMLVTVLLYCIYAVRVIVFIDFNTSDEFTPH